MTQKERLLNWFMQTNITINPLQSWAELGIYRLSDTVFKLKADGYDIETELVTVKNRFDEDCEVAQYRYKGKKGKTAFTPFMVSKSGKHQEQTLNFTVR
jgi:hypothetical protein